MTADSSVTARGQPRRYWMPVVVLALGVGSILLLLGSNWIQERLIGADIGSLRALEEIQTRMAITHLWIEEYVTGDEVDLGEIEESLERANKLAAAIVTRYAPSRERLALDSDADAHIAALATSAAAEIRNFGRRTHKRRTGSDAGLDVGIGSPADIAYDRTFADLLGSLGQLQQALVLRVSTSERQARLLFHGLLLAWSLIVVLAALGLWSRERRQRLAEIALDESRAQLLQAQKMEAVGQLAGGVAHDINNYLAAIAAQCELVRMETDPGGATAKRMDAVLATIDRAGSLIERLLAFSRRQPARPEAVSLNRVVKSVETMLTQLLGEDIELRSRLAPDLWPIEIDLSQIEQIVLNLAVNAREAMPTGGVLTIETENIPRARSGRRAMASGDFVVLRVADSGGGIADSVRQKIFDPFFTTKGTSHSGLGLATVLGVVEQNGGRLKVDSGSGGSTFEVLLPRSTTEVPPVREDESDAELPSVASGTVLLVEDNAELRQSSGDLLEAWGYTVTSAADAEDAIRLFEKRASDFDLLITDVVMPGLNGRDLALRLGQADPSLRILFMSGHTDDVVLRHGIETGKVDFLPKPFSARQLGDKVRSALER